MQSACATALGAERKWDLTGRRGRARVRPRPRARPRQLRSCGCGLRVLTASRAHRPPHPPPAYGGGRARRPHLGPHPDAAAQPLPLRHPGDPPAAGEAEPPLEADLHDADGRAAAALLDPDQLAQPRHPRLRLLHREPPARAGTGWRDPADHRLRRAARASAARDRAARPAARAGGDRAAARGDRMPAARSTRSTATTTSPDAALRSVWQTRPPMATVRSRRGGRRRPLPPVLRDSARRRRPADAGRRGRARRRRARRRLRRRRPGRSTAPRRSAPADTLAWVHLSTDGDRDASSRRRSRSPAAPGLSTAR